MTPDRPAPAPSPRGLRTLRAHPWIGALLLVAAALLLWRLAQASTITVTTTADTVDGNTSSIAALIASPGADGKISLREAITAANNDAAPGPHTLVLPAGSYAHTQGAMAVSAAVTLQGAGAGSTTIAVTGGTRAFTSSNSLTLTGLTLSGGYADTGTGGCIQANAGTLTLTSATLTGCTANSGSGGAIATSGSALTLTAVTLTNNNAPNGNGGAIWLGDGNATVSGSTFSGNGAVNGNGGAVFVAGSANLTVTDSSFTGNQADSGGGIRQAGSGLVSITGATFANNSGGNGRGGGLLVSAGSATVTNATFTGNSTTLSGGGVAVSSGSATLTNVTVAGNSGGNGAGGLLLSGGSLAVRNTLVSGNSGNGGNCSGAIANTANNLDSGSTCGFGSANGSLSNANAQLAALASNGGSTQTMALGSSSAAINAGTATGAPATDQRGSARNGAPDIGAYEYGGSVPGTLSLAGSVFEDANYGGGAGRSLAASGGSGVGGATVELYNGSGGFVSSTVTAANGGYSFTGLTSGSYFVRVVGGTVRSQRSGSSASVLGVPTFLTDASSGSAAAVTNQVGGTNPALSDPGAAASGAAFNTSSYVYSVGLAGTAQSVAPVALSANLAGVDFGFNFDSVVNTNDSGAGSLRQAISNANTLSGDAGLAQSGRPAGIENLVFMIGNGSAAAGLRSSVNLFGGGVATIAPTSALPAVSTPMVIDGQTQPGWSSAPLIDLNGSGTSSASGLWLSGATGVTVRGLVIRNFGQSGIDITGGGSHTIAGNYLGTNAAGTAAAANTNQGVNVWQSSGNTIGGSTAGARNVISGNATNGIVVTGTGASNNVIAGNYIGTNAAGTAAVKNGSLGVYLGSAGNTVGGSAAGAGNLISGNTYTGVNIDTGATSTTVQGNTIGLNAAGSAALANGTCGIYLNSSSATLGGTAAGAGNTIAGNTGDGICFGGGAVSGTLIQGNRIGTNAAGAAGLGNGGNGINVTGAATGNSIGGTASGAGNTVRSNTGRGVNLAGTGSGNAVRGNAIWGNSQIGIDLRGDGITANDGAKTNSQPNLLMDAPVITRATLAGTTLTLAGYVGSAAGQAAFASARVEFFISDASSASGSGKTYLGSLTADASGNFSGALTGISGVTAGTTPLTATATDGANNTSEFGANTTVAALSISGTVFEDANYGGGPGRSRAVSGGSAVAGAVVELYDAGGTFVATTTTDAAGAYSFAGLAPASYAVRVVNASVASQRSGSAASLVGVMTFRTDASSGTAVAVADRVGGTSPALVDPGAASSGAVLNPATGVYSAGPSGTAQSLTPVVLGTAAVASVDFGFNFDSVVNTNAAGPGSLRQAIVNANTLGGDGALAQAGRPAGIENLVFMVSNGSTGGGGSLGLAAGGLRAANNLFATSAGGYLVATVAPTAALPTITSALVIDAQTQPGWTQNPLIEIRGNAAASGTAGLTLAAGAVTLRGLVINRFSSHGISITAGGGDTVQGCWIGLDASGSAGSANSGDGVHAAGTGSGHQIGGTTAAQRNLIGANNYGVYLGGGGGHAVQGNYIGTNAAGSAAVGNRSRAVFFDTGVASATLGGTAAGAGNVIAGNLDYAVWLAGGPATVQGNLIGLNAAGTAALGNAMGLYAPSGGHLIGGTVAAARNVVSGHVAGVPNQTPRGIWLNSNGNTVQGNYVGTNAAGSAALPNLDGIYVKGSNNVIGGSAAGAGNLISGNSGRGVQVPSGMTGNAILGNAIHGNGNLGIDLGADGITANDGAKTGGAANLLMDSPVITAARARGNLLTLAGYVGSAAGQALFANARVEFFISDSAFTNGSGKTYLGTLTSDAAGNFSGSLTTQSLLRAGTVLTATATDTANNTSEFGVNFTGLVVDWVVNSTADGDDANPGDGVCETSTPGQCTLRAALMEANAALQAGAASTPPTIAFALPGCTAAGAAGCTITPTGALPSIAHAVSVDGSTQTGWSAGSGRCAPWVELSGAATAANTSGLVVSTDGATLRALIVNRYAGSGIVLSGNGNTVACSYVGTTASGLAAAGNGGPGINVTGAANAIGGASASDGNLITGNGPSGILLSGGSVTGTLVQGNWIGTDSAGNALTSVSQHSQAGILLTAGARANTIGGTASGAGNAITASAGAGIGLTGTARDANAIRGNRTWANQGLGIDLGQNGVTVNGGALDTSQPNNGMNQPVFTGAGYDATSGTLTVFGHVGSARGQAAFGGATVEVYRADGDASGYGEGALPLGSLATAADGSFSGTFSVAAGSVAVGDAVTGVATDAGGNSSEFGPRWTTTTPAGLSPSRFNAFEPTTPAGSLSGVIKTKTVGVATGLDVIAIDNSGSALQSTFSGSVTLTWMDARDNSGALDGGNCRTSWVAGASAGTASFNGSGRTSVSLTPPGVGREWRLRMQYTPPVGAVVTACSTDNFAIKPVALRFTGVSDGNDSSAGTARALDNAVAGGGVVHRAGRPFSIRAAAVDGGNAVQAGYDGVPTLALTGCTLPASGCTPGTLVAGTLSVGAGVIASDSATYSEVGAVTAKLSDANFASVDAADSSAAERLVESTDTTIGRFVPDNYTASATGPGATPGVFATGNASCTAAGAGFTWYGQAFGWSTPPAVLVTARNFAGDVTSNWKGALMKLGAGSVSGTLTASGVSNAVTSTFGPITVADNGNGSATLTRSSTDWFSLARSNTVPSPSATPAFALATLLTDNSEVAGGNGPTSASVTQSAIAFNAGGTFHHGRLQLFSGHGDARTGVRLLAELQRYTAAGWLRLAEDNGCVTLAPAALAYDNGRGAFAGAALCSAPVSAAVTTRGGRAWLALPPSPFGTTGALRLRLNLGVSASGTTCTAGTPQAASTLNLPLLQGAYNGVATLDQDPTANATWGRANREVLVRRERYD